MAAPQEVCRAGGARQAGCALPGIACLGGGCAASAGGKCERDAWAVKSLGSTTPSRTNSGSENTAKPGQLHCLQCPKRWASRLSGAQVRHRQLSTGPEQAGMQISWACTYMAGWRICICGTLCSCNAHAHARMDACRRACKQEGTHRFSRRKAPGCSHSGGIGDASGGPKCCNFKDLSHGR